MEAKNSAYTKQYNRRRVLSLLRQSPMSRADLARQMGLTRAAISLITEELMEEGLLRESKSVCRTPGPGRFPTLLKLQSNALYAVGISLGREACYVGIEDLCGQVLEQQLLEYTNPGELIEAVKAFLSRSKRPIKKILGVGVSSPGPVDVEKGMILNPPDFKMWAGFPICQELTAATGLPAWLENDANAAAIYNRRVGGFEETDNFLLLYVGSGVGSGAVSQGRLLRSCELGHVSIDHQGIPCSCGNHGCLERYASLHRIAKAFSCQSWQALMESSNRRQALEKEADYLATAIVNFSNLVPIGAVLLDGPLQTCSEEILPMISRRIQGRSLSGRPIRMLSAVCHEHVRIYCACGIVFSRYLITE